MHTKNGHKKVNLVSLGCSKNLVDSEILLRQFQSNGLEIIENSKKADYIVINTCGFINDAKEESIRAILEAVDLKKSGKVKKVVVMGCLSERYKSELVEEIPEVDAYFGVTDYRGVLSELGLDLKKELLGERLITTPKHFAYLKISEGCDNPCSFCAIPLIRGKHQSKPIEQVLSEAEFLAKNGAKEIILIAQDSTYYGLDLYGTRQLAALLKELTKIEGIEWIRLLYAFPAKFPEEILDVIAQEEKICKYIDIPFQHISDKILKSMQRGVSKRRTYELIDLIRNKIPEVAIRTTLIVGYPEEGEKEFQELVDFVKDVKFDRLGVFTYSQEESTKAYELGDPIPQKVKEERKKEILRIQQEISHQKNLEKIGKRIKVLIDEKIDQNVFLGRSQWDAPEVDNSVFVNTTKSIEPGNFYEVEIDDALEFDLAGQVI
ncbi:MAG: 30S ribosomal protein S12 methylthiotransferase RimO [Ignavibacteria bacterium]|jgi:ribosomal protein S12 methylthiotransferase|nr:30S ribosomal protein S12 methylthiotransferase RimO [Ignavibacteria bacterium]MDH7526654.1 30S ribosomal protein S12 methylthiotransferase RimO [Ignavibacteria bacterium]NPV11491.1 30S ribosomal protein S12 methylthiotransferase RimO [Ignavibacteria bacterium]